MVEYQAQQLDHIFRALSDPTRRSILQRLMDGELTVGELARPYEISLAAAVTLNEARFTITSNCANPAELSYLSIQVTSANYRSDTNPIDKLGIFSLELK